MNWKYKILVDKKGGPVKNNDWIYVLLAFLLPFVMFILIGVFK